MRCSSQINKRAQPNCVLRHQQETLKASLNSWPLGCSTQNPKSTLHLFVDHIFSLSPKVSSFTNLANPYKTSYSYIELSIATLSAPIKVINNLYSCPLPYRLPTASILAHNAVSEMLRWDYIVWIFYLIIPAIYHKWNGSKTVRH